MTPSQSAWLSVSDRDQRLRPFCAGPAASAQTQASDTRSVMSLSTRAPAGCLQRIEGSAVCCCLFKQLSQSQRTATGWSSFAPERPAGAAPSPGLSPLLPTPHRQRPPRRAGPSSTAAPIRIAPQSPPLCRRLRQPLRLVSRASLASHPEVRSALRKALSPINSATVGAAAGFIDALVLAPLSSRSHRPAGRI